jgi:DNA-binding LacI/PurR family transcriptional regulator
MDYLKKYKIDKIDATNGNSIFIQLKNIILSLIEGDILKIGDKIPSKSTFIKAFEISANPCNKAISELIQDGILQGHQGKGVFVRAKYARSISSSKCISLLCSDSKTLEHFAFSETVNGIIDIISSYGYNLTFNFINPKQMNREEIHDKLGLIQAAGIIIPYIPGLSEEDLAPLIPNTLPAVCIGKSYPSVTPYCIHTNIKPAVEEFVSKLQLPKKDLTVAFIGGPFSEFFSTHQKAYIDSLEAADYQLKKIIIKRCPFDMKAGKEAMEQVLEEEKILPDLIIAEDDYVACGAISVLHKHNIQIKKDVTFLTIGGFLKSLYPLNESSIICLNHRGLGEQAASLLMKSINHKPIEQDKVYVPGPCIWV